MGKPIEPGCLCIVVDPDGKLRFRCARGLIVTVIRKHIKLSDGQYSHDDDNYWDVKSEKLTMLVGLHPGAMNVAHEKYLRRIDDGDFNPAAEGEDNPYRQVTPRHILAPARQV